MSDQSELDDSQVRDAEAYRAKLRARGITNRSARIAHMEKLSMERRDQKISAEEIMLRKSVRYRGWR